MNGVLLIDTAMKEQELNWLRQEAKHHKCCLEIGSYLGASTVAIAQGIQDCVIAWDDWYGPRDVQMSAEERGDRLYMKFLAHVKLAGMEYKVMALRADHSVLPEWLHPSFSPPIDMVFIDGSHVYEDVLRDIANARKVTRDKGLICGHDWSWDSVKSAVLDSQLGKLLHVPVKEGAGIWAVWL